MEDTTFPPMPNWAFPPFLPKNLASREDGSVAYGSKHNIVILKNMSNKNVDTVIIRHAHKNTVVSVAFSPLTCDESFQNTVASCSDDGLVKLWKIDTRTSFIGHKSHWENQKTFGKVICLDWSVANPHVIVSVADNNTLVLWDILSNTTVKFSFPKVKLTATTLVCCPHSEKLVAVGVKSGLIYVIHLTENGKIIYVLRGHDNEIQSLYWCPVVYNVFKKNELCEEFLLASACRNKEVFIWRAGSDGKCEIKYQIPTHSILEKGREQNRPHLRDNFSFLVVFWHDAYSLYFSSNFGELLLFDINSYLDNVPKTSETKASKQFLHCLKVGHNFHSKGLYGIAGVPMHGDIILNKEVNIKSELKFKTKLSSNIVKNFDSCSDSESSWNVSTPESLGLLWTVGQDSKLVACKYHNSKLRIVFNLHAINGWVYSAVVSPHDCNKIAIGAGDGMIRLWNLLQPVSEVQVFWKKIKDRVMCLAWHPTKDGLLAYGTSKGRIGLIDTNSNKMPKVFKPDHSKPVYSLSWGPHTDSNGVSSSEFDLYCTGDNTLSVYDCSNMSADAINLTKLIPFKCKKQTDVSWKPDYSLMAVGCDDGTIDLVEPATFKIVHTLSDYKNLIESIAWHPVSTSLESGPSRYRGYFTSGSTDKENVIRIFNCVSDGDGVKVERVACLKCHFGHVKFASWSPHLSGRLVSTTSDDFVQIWDVTSQILLFNVMFSAVPIFSIWSPINPDAILTGYLENFMMVWKISSRTDVEAPATISTKVGNHKKSKKNELSLAKISSAENPEVSTAGRKKEGEEKVEEEEEERNGEISKMAMAEARHVVKNPKESKMFSKPWGDNSKNELDVLYSILTGNDLNFSSPFLSANDEKYLESINSQEEMHKAAKNWTEYYELALWSGKLKEVIEEKIKTGQLNDFLVSLAPTVSPRLWQQACISYSKSLAEKGSFRKAASYLVACHKIYEAIDLLRGENLFFEALCIAKSRLPESDPVVADIIGSHADWLAENGSCLKACECYVYLKDYLKVAKTCGRKCQPEYLSLAALAARKSGHEELEFSEGSNALTKCLKSCNFELAKRICDDHDNLKYFRLLFHVHQTIHQLSEKKITLEKDILSHVKTLMDTSEVIFPPNLLRLYQKYTFYSSREEVLVVAAQEISFAACAESPVEIASHLIKALSTCNRYIPDSVNESDSLLYNMCCWLSPYGTLSEEGILSSIEESIDESKRESLREFEIAAIVGNWNFDSDAGNAMRWIARLGKFENVFLNEKSLKYYQNLTDLDACEKRLMASQKDLARRKIKSLVNGNHRGGGDCGGKNSNGFRNDEAKDEVLEKKENGGEKLNDIRNGEAEDELVEREENGRESSNGFRNDEAKHEVLEKKENGKHLNGLRSEEIEEKLFEKKEDSKKEEAGNRSNLNIEKSDESEVKYAENDLENSGETNKTDLKYSETNDETKEADFLEDIIIRDKDLLTELTCEIEIFEKTKISSPNPVPVFYTLKKICATVPQSETAKILLENLEKKWFEINGKLQ